MYKRNFFGSLNSRTVNPQWLWRKRTSQFFSRVCQKKWRREKREEKRDEWRGLDWNFFRIRVKNPTLRIPGASRYKADNDGPYSVGRTHCTPTIHTSFGSLKREEQEEWKTRKRWERKTEGKTFCEGLHKMRFKRVPSNQPNAVWILAKVSLPDDKRPNAADANLETVNVLNFF